MRPATLAVCLLASSVAAPSYAEGKGPYREEVGGWIIESIFDSCVAYNRPSVELQFAVVHALGLALDAEGNMNLVAGFWPGAVDPADQHIGFALGDVAEELKGTPSPEDDTFRTDPLPALVVAESSTATGGALTAVTVIVTVVVLLSAVPSFTR